MPSTWTILNPLPHALKHYEDALVSEFAGPLERGRRVRVEAEIGSMTLLQKVRIAFSTTIRLVVLNKTRGPVLVLWPTFGLAELAFWRAGNGRRLVIVHDPVPLRRQHGYGRVGGLLGRWGARGRRVEVVAHTKLAAHALERRGIEVRHVLDHPVMQRSRSAKGERGPTVVQVLGQFKEARDVELLVNFAKRAPACWRLQINGRGWPAVPGWDVESRFLTEEEMDEAVSSADVVLLPYRHYFQSGVATRAYELGVPVAGARHEYLERLFGTAWPGMAEDESAEQMLKATTAVASLQLPISPNVPSARRSRVIAAWLEALNQHSD